MRTVLVAAAALLAWWLARALAGRMGSRRQERAEADRSGDFCRVTGADGQRLRGGTVAAA